MTVPTLTKEQAARRERPGGGKLHPVCHIVRIVVVGPASSSRDHGPGDSHEQLTDGELEAAEAVLKGMHAPPSSSGTPGDATSTQPQNMLEALSPTDIVVVGREPASVRTVKGKDDKPSRRLWRHDDRNTDTVLRVWTESDTIEYQCAEPFAIVGVKRAGWKIYDAPDNPFGFGEVEYIAQKRKNDTDDKPIWVWTSGLLPATANNQQYKMTFKIGDQLIDPDVACGSPPPS